MFVTQVLIELYLTNCSKEMKVSGVSVQVSGLSDPPS